MWRSVSLLAVGLALAVAVEPTASSALAASRASGSVRQLSLSESPVDSGTTFGLLTDTPLYCPGDADKGYRWGTFITPADNDPSTLTYRLGQPFGVGFTEALTDSTSVAISNRDPGFGDGFVSPPAGIRLSSPRYSSMTAGDYRLGVACTKRDAGNTYRVVRHWYIPVVVERAEGAGPNGFVLRSAGAPSIGTSGTTGETAVEPAIPTEGALEATAVENSDPMVEAAADPVTDPTAGDPMVVDSAAAPSPGASDGGSAAGWWLLWLAVAAMLARIGYLISRRARTRRQGGL